MVSVYRRFGFRSAQPNLDNSIEAFERKAARSLQKPASRYSPTSALGSISPVIGEKGAYQKPSGGRILERISFTEIIALDKALELDGQLIAICWAAGEFQTGITRIKAIEDQNTFPNFGWDPEEYAFADTLLTINRWNQIMALNKDWWLELKRVLTFYSEP